MAGAGLVQKPGASSRSSTWTHLPRFPVRLCRELHGKGSSWALKYSLAEAEFAHLPKAFSPKPTSFPAQLRLGWALASGAGLVCAWCWLWQPGAWRDLTALS